MQYQFDAIGEIFGSVYRALQFNEGTHKKQNSFVSPTFFHLKRESQMEATAGESTCYVTRYKPKDPGK